MYGMNGNQRSHPYNMYSNNINNTNNIDDDGYEKRLEQQGRQGERQSNLPPQLHETITLTSNTSTLSSLTEEPVCRDGSIGGESIEQPLYQNPSNRLHHIHPSTLNSRQPSEGGNSITFQPKRNQSENQNANGRRRPSSGDSVTRPSTAFINARGPKNNNNDDDKNQQQHTQTPNNAKSQSTGQDPDQAAKERERMVRMSLISSTTTNTDHLYHHDSQLAPSSSKQRQTTGLTSVGGPGQITDQPLLTTSLQHDINRRPTNASDSVGSHLQAPPRHSHHSKIHHHDDNSDEASNSTGNQSSVGAQAAYLPPRSDHDNDGLGKHANYTTHSNQEQPPPPSTTPTKQMPSPASVAASQNRMRRSQARRQQRMSTRLHDTIPSNSIITTSIMEHNDGNDDTTFQNQDISPPHNRTHDPDPNPTPLPTSKPADFRSSHHHHQSHSHSHASASASAGVENRFQRSQVRRNQRMSKISDDTQIKNSIRASMDAISISLQDQNEQPHTANDDNYQYHQDSYNSNSQQPFSQNSSTNTSNTTPIQSNHHQQQQHFQDSSSSSFQDSIHDLAVVGLHSSEILNLTAPPQEGSSQELNSQWGNSTALTTYSSQHPISNDPDSIRNRQSSLQTSQPSLSTANDLDKQNYVGRYYIASNNGNGNRDENDNDCRRGSNEDDTYIVGEDQTSKKIDNYHQGGKLPDNVQSYKDDNKNINNGGVATQQNNDKNSPPDDYPQLDETPPQTISLEQRTQTILALTGLSTTGLDVMADSDDDDNNNEKGAHNSFRPALENKQQQNTTDKAEAAQTSDYTIEHNEKISLERPTDKIHLEDTHNFNSGDQKRNINAVGGAPPSAARNATRYSSVSRSGSTPSVTSTGTPTPPPPGSLNRQTEIQRHPRTGAIAVVGARGVIQTKGRLTQQPFEQSSHQDNPATAGPDNTNRDLVAVTRSLVPADSESRSFYMRNGNSNANAENEIQEAPSRNESLLSNPQSQLSGVSGNTGEVTETSTTKTHDVDTKYGIGLAIACCCSIIIIAVAVVIVTTRKNNNGPTVPSPTFAPTSLAFIPSPYEDQLKHFSGTNPSALTDVSSYQYQALQWLDSDFLFHEDDDKKLVSRYALAVLFFATNGVEWSNSFNFLTATDHCTWQMEISPNPENQELILETGGTLGVICDKDGFVEKIILRDNNLQGTVPEELQALSALKTLDLQGNKIDSIVPWDSALMSLLNLNFNSLVGEAANSVPKFTQLTSLDLSSNKLDISILTSIQGMPNLNRLNINFNELDGAATAAMFADLTSLQHLELVDNSLSGDIGFVTLLSELTHLDLEGNNFANTLPAVLPQKLKLINLYGNQFSGVLPPALLDSLTMLEVLDIGKNDFAGNIPWSSFSETLQILSMPDNKFVGSLPTLRQEPNNAYPMSLEKLDLGNNQMFGTMPANFMTYLTNLRELILNRNQFRGAVPESYTPSLKKLDLSANKFDGALPQMFENATGLEILNLASNELSSTIPENAFPTSLLELYLAMNSLTGTIPSSIGNLRSLQVLHLTSNLLDGSFPNSLGLLTDLREFRIEFNLFSGSVEVLCNLGVVEAALADCTVDCSCCTDCFFR